VSEEYAIVHGLGSDECKVGEPQIDNINPFVPRPMQGLVRLEVDGNGQVVDGTGILLVYASRYARQVMAKMILTLLQDFLVSFKMMRGLTVGDENIGQNEV